MGQSLGHLEAISLKRDDIDDLMGNWYEIAVIKNQFENKCIGAIATYTNWKSSVQVKELLEQKRTELGYDTLAYADWYRTWRSSEMDTFEVANYCVYKTPMKQIEWACQLGKATLIQQDEDQVKGQFVVQFSKYLPFDIIARAGGNYRVVDLNIEKNNPSEAYLVVWGGRDEFFWVLSRSPTFSTTSTFEMLKEKYKPWMDKTDIRDPSIYETFHNWQQNQCIQHPEKQEHN